MAKVNGNMSAEQFFWKQIDKDGSGRLETIFEINEAESRGFSVKIGMTEEEFIAKNKKAIQKKALFDIDYSNYQLEQEKRKQEIKQKNLKEKLSQIKDKLSKLNGTKPNMGINKEEENDKTEMMNTEANKTEGKTENSLSNVSLPTAEDLSSVLDEDKEVTKANYVKIYLNHAKRSENGDRVTILPDKLEELLKQAEEEFETKWTASRKLIMEEA